MSPYDFTLPGSSRKGVLLVHGLTGSPAEMRFVGKALHRLGFTVHAPTMAGHCADMKTLTATHYEDWVDSIRAAILRFSQTVDELYIAGICVGGAVGLCAAHMEPQVVKGAAIYSPLLRHDGWNVPSYYALDRLCAPLAAHVPGLNRMAFGEAEPYGIKSTRIRKAIIGRGDGIEGTLPKFPLKGVYQNLRLVDALTEMLPDIRIPTLLIHAQEDDLAHPRNALRIQQLHGGRCEVVLLEDSYHMIHVDQERHKVAQLTANFFGVTQAQDVPAVEKAA